MTELVTFVRARLEERRAAAQAAYDEASDYEVVGSDLAEAHFLYWRPAEVLADVEAKLRIVDTCSRDIGYEEEGLANQILDLLALPFAGRPDYDESWRP